MKTQTAVIILLLGASALAAGLLVTIDQRLKLGFERVAEGATRADVVEILGEPHHIAQCNSFGGERTGKCAREMVFLSYLSFTDVWLVKLDRNDRVAGKVRLRSP